MKRGFTLIEMLLATLLFGIVMTLSFLTFWAVSRGWQTSTDYLDKIQHTDYAINQLISALRSSYYPRVEDENYGFYDPYDREGRDADDSDIIEWTKKGSSLIGSGTALADSVHRVRVMVLEEGATEDGDDEKFPKFKFREPIRKTGLYARAFVDPALAAGEEDETNESAHDYYTQPTLIADGIVGFRCRTIKEAPAPESDQAGQKGSYVKDKLEDTYEDKKFPYKVELTLFMEVEDDRFASQSEKRTVIRTVRIPIHEQSKEPK